MMLVHGKDKAGAMWYMDKTRLEPCGTERQGWSHVVHRSHVVHWSHVLLLFETEGP